MAVRSTRLWAVQGLVGTQTAFTVPAGRTAIVKAYVVDGTYAAGGVITTTGLLGGTPVRLSRIVSAAAGPLINVLGQAFFVLLAGDQIQFTMSAGTTCFHAGFGALLLGDPT